MTHTFRLFLTGLLLCTGLFYCFAPGASADMTDELAGTWTLSLDTPRGIQHPTLEIREDGSGYSGTYNSLRGPIEIESITRDGNSFSFPLMITVPIGDIEVNYRGSFEGDEMTGTVENPRGTVPFTATRATP